MLISKEQQEIIANVVEYDKDIIWLSKYDYAKGYVVELEARIKEIKLHLKKDGVELE